MDGSFFSTPLLYFALNTFSKKLFSAVWWRMDMQIVLVLDVMRFQILNQSRLISSVIDQVFLIRMFSLQLPSFRISDEAIYPESKREFLLFCDFL